MIKREPSAGKPWRALKQVLRQRSLLLWLSGVALCGLMDELLAVFIGLRSYSELGSVGWITASLLSFALGGVCGTPREPSSSRCST